MKNKTTLTLCISAVVTSMMMTPVQAKESQTWIDFKEAKAQNKRLPIPDFSYAGYQRGEKAIPAPNWPIVNVNDFGAMPDDGIDDIDAINVAIDEAEKLNGAILFFPKGRYLLSERKNIEDSLLKITASKLIIRGEGDGDNGTELFFKERLNSTTPSKMWTTPKMVTFNGSSSSYKGDKVSEIKANAKLGDFTISVKDPSKFSAGQYIIINLNDRSAANDDALSPFKVESAMTKFKTGEFQREFHQIDKISGNTITLKEPIHMDIDAQYTWEVRKMTLGQQLGIEDIAFVGNWKENFDHHKNVVHDSGWSALAIDQYANSWLKNVRFKDWNAMLTIGSSMYISGINITTEGNRGHSSIHVNNSYGVLITHSQGLGEGQYHGQGVSAYSAGIVFHRNVWPKQTSFDSHASFPHATLFDRVDGGYSGASGGGGGSAGSQPNHMRDLVFWNFKDLGDRNGVSDTWWQTSTYRRYLMPKLIGWHGVTPKFTAGQMAINESFGTKVEPESLYEAQLELRLGDLPGWLKELKGETGGGNEPDDDNQAPQVSFDNLPASFIQGEDIVISANAFDDDKLSTVSLFIDNALIEEKTTAPYRWQDQDKFNGLSLGQHTVKVVAIDNEGLSRETAKQFDIVVPTVEPTIALSLNPLAKNTYIENEEATVLSFNVTISGEPVTLDDLTIKADGELSEVDDVNNVFVYYDKNKNNKADTNERVGQASFTKDNALLNIQVTDFDLAPGDHTLFINYKF